MKSCAPSRVSLRGILSGALVIAAAALLSSCGEASEYEPTEASRFESTSSDVSSIGGGFSGGEEEERASFDEDAAREVAEDELSEDSYVGIGSPYGCTEDCSGHEAGFQYRAENGYAAFNADSPSFNEGGQAFEEAVEERVEEMKRDYESGGEAPY